MGDIAPGWYQDDDDERLARWWDGNTWTHHTLVIGDQRPEVEPEPPLPTRFPVPEPPRELLEDPEDEEDEWASYLPVDEPHYELRGTYQPVRETGLEARWPEAGVVTEHASSVEWDDDDYDRDDHGRDDDALDWYADDDDVDDEPEPREPEPPEPVLVGWPAVRDPGVWGDSPLPRGGGLAFEEPGRRRRHEIEARPLTLGDRVRELPTWARMALPVVAVALVVGLVATAGALRSGGGAGGTSGTTSPDPQRLRAAGELAIDTAGVPWFTLQGYLASIPPTCEAAHDDDPQRVADRIILLGYDDPTVGHLVDGLEAAIRSYCPSDLVDPAFFDEIYVKAGADPAATSTTIGVPPATTEPEVAVTPTTAKRSTTTTVKRSAAGPAPTTTRPPTTTTTAPTTTTSTTEPTSTSEPVI